MYYGLDERAEVRASDLLGDALHGHSFTLHYHDVHLPVQLQIPGKHGVSTALAAAAAGFLAGIAPEAISSALGSLVAVKGRGEIKRGPNGSTLIDDSYKANRQSILAGIAVLHGTDLTGGGKRWAVLGDMLDLAQYARDEHYATGQALVGQVDYLVAIGDQARFYVEGAREAGMPADKLFLFKADPADQGQLEAAKRDVIAFLNEKVQSNDLLILKGSNPLGLQAIVEKF
jgi:UDP-N-acetylmuramoyl-tripeptide--D-alanyl-D-alanine ligase